MFFPKKHPEFGEDHLSRGKCIKMASRGSAPEEKRAFGGISIKKKEFGACQKCG